jgi:predicted DNA-binding WGR domain protein
MKKVYLELRDTKSSKFWEIEVTGPSTTVRFGKIGTAGQIRVKEHPSAEAAIAGATKLIAEKTASGYGAPSAPEAVPSATADRPNASPLRGATFLRETKGVTANAIAAKLREDGKVSKVDPRSVDGFGPDGLVGVAIYPPRTGYWAVVDSADGSQGIGGGEWSRPAFMANQLGTDVVWYRIYSEGLGLGVRYGGGALGAIASDAKGVLTWLKSQGAPVDESVRPKDAPKNATLITIKYESPAYRTGPDASVAEAVLAVSRALARGDAVAVREAYSSMAEDFLPLALGVIRSANEGRSAACLVELAMLSLADPMKPRVRTKDATIEEVVLGRVATRGDAAFLEQCVARLDAIESEAESRSAFASAIGLAGLADELAQSKRMADAFRVYRRIILRTRPPHWHQYHRALGALLSSTKGKIELVGEAKEVVSACEARLPELGESAKDAIVYNLACVYARAGSTGRALAALRACKTLRAQNPHPEKDSDLESLHAHPDFVPILGGNGRVEPSAPDSGVADEASEAEADAVPPADRAVPRLTITLHEGGDSGQTSRIGGLPSAPSKSELWPESAQRPLQLVFQIVGKAAGGEVDLGDIHVIQAFADLEGDFYEAGCQRVVIHRRPCPVVLAAPPGIDPLPVRRMSFEPGADDRVVTVKNPGDEDELRQVGAPPGTYDAAWSHAWCNKIRGIPIGGNLDPDERDVHDAPMECIVQLVDFDDWFLWYLFMSKDGSEARLQVVRG